jgi:superfamily II DNA or RNA helicase
MPVELRPYQQEAVDKVRVAMRTHRRVLLQSPTGSGKTRIAAHIAEAVLVHNKSVTILAHRIEIVNQFSRAFSEFGIRHGVIAPDRYETNWPCQIAMVATLANRLDRVRKPSLMIADEAHHFVAGTYGKVAEYWGDVHRLGLTATPMRLDGRGLDDCFDTLVTGKSVRWLIDNGYLSPFRLIGPPVVADLSNLKKKMGDFIPGQVVDAMDRPPITGDAEAHYRQYLNGAPAIGFCASVAHARHAAAEFCARGWKAAAVDGSSPDRDKLIASIGDGRLNVLFSCSLIDEGTDIPVVQGCIILAPTMSLARYLQRVGRVLRPKPDGSAAVILDHVGDARDRHGRPDWQHKWTLEGKKRNANHRAPASRTCPKCFLVFPPAAKCPDCGHEFPASASRGFIPPAHAPGQLVEMTEEYLREAPLHVLTRNASTFAELDAIRKARGYHSNWTYHQMHFLRRKLQDAERHGVAPVRRFG